MVQNNFKWCVIKCVITLILCQEIISSDGSNKTFDNEYIENVKVDKRNIPFQIESPEVSWDNESPIQPNSKGRISYKYQPKQQYNYKQMNINEPGDRRKITKKILYGNDKKIKQPNSFDQKSIYRQLDKIPKDKLLADPYKFVKIKESESAEKNLKKLLKILDENLSFQFGAVPQPRIKVKNREDTSTRYDNLPMDYEVFQDQLIDRDKQFEKQNEPLSDTKSLVADTKQFVSPKDLSVLEEILISEIRRIIKNKEIVSAQKHLLTPSLGANDLSGKDEIKTYYGPNPIDDESRSLITFLAPLLVQLEEDHALTANNLYNTNEFNLNYPASIKGLLHHT